MEIKVLDNTGKPLSADQLSMLKIWNGTISHVCASALERLHHDDFSNPVTVENETNT